MTDRPAYDERYAFICHGSPRPQGSKNAYINPRTGKIMLVESSKSLPPWRRSVATAAAMSWPNGARPWEFPVGLGLLFVVERPAIHYGTGRNATTLKSSAPPWPIAQQVGDLDKLERAICDAITGIVIFDDKQVCTMNSRKVYGSPERVEVSIAALGVPMSYEAAAA